MRLLHCCSGIRAGRIFGKKHDLAVQDAAFGVDLLDRKFTTDLLVLAELGVGAGEGIVETDLDLFCGARRNDERRSDLRSTERRSRLEHAAPV